MPDKSYVDCWECVNFYECNYSGILTGRLTSCPEYKQKPMTNADRIRSMTDEELCDWVSDGCPQDECDSSIIDCWTCWMRWLKQPAEEADHDRS